MYIATYKDGPRKIRAGSLGHEGEPGYKPFYWDCGFCAWKEFKETGKVRLDAEPELAGQLSSQEDAAFEHILLFFGTGPGEVWPAYLCTPCLASLHDGRLTEDMAAALAADAPGRRPW